MAIDAFPESPISRMSSPRISFSHDLHRQSEAVPVEENYVRPQASPCEFDFCVFRQNLDFYEASSSSYADELFLDGKILPTKIKKQLPPIPPPGQVEVEEPPTHRKTSDRRRSEEKPKSSWLFRRSSSLNCGVGYSGSSLCPLPLLSRSFSTGSNASRKQQRPSVELHSKYLLKNQRDRSITASYSNPSASSSSRPLWKFKPKNSSSSSNYPCASSYYSGVKFQPVLNVLPPSNLFCLGSIFPSRTNRRN